MYCSDPANEHYFNSRIAPSFQPVLHDWCNIDRGMCYPVWGMGHIKEPLLLIGTSSPCNGPLPYVRRHITVNNMYWGRR